MKAYKHPWFKRRGYLHFDSPVSLSTATRLVTCPKRVAKHPFFPLIHYTIRSLKISVDDKGQVEKKWKDREIKYASHLDSHIYSFYAKELAKLYESEVSKRMLNANVLAFRSLGKSNIDFADDVFELIKAKGRCSVIGLDISGFFDNLSHTVLKNQWSRLLDVKQLPEDHYKVFRSLTKFAYVDRNTLYKNMGISRNNPKNGRYKICSPSEFRDLVRSKGLVKTNGNTFGIPQGTPISALLSNIYMLDFDTQMKAVLEEQGGHYFRYCDDMLFITSNEFRDGVEKIAVDEIKKLELEINTKKTEKRDFYRYGGLLKCKGNKSLQYLGFTFDGERKLLRSAAIAKFSGRMRAGVRLAKKTVKRLNYENIIAGNPEVVQLRKKKLYERYSHLGKRNFMRYGYRAAKEMNSKAIKKQLKPFWNRMQNEMNK